MREELLEYVFKSSGEACLSDLRIPTILKTNLPFILKIEEEQFSIMEWQQLYTYLLGMPTNLKDIAAIKQAIADWTNGK